jgi:hypothetical protein
MKTESFNEQVVRQILVGLLTDESVLSTTILFYQQNKYLFEDATANQILEYCVQYHEQYNRPPNRDIIDWANSLQQTNPSQSSLILTLLHSLTPNQTNSDRLSDVAVNYYRTTQIKQFVTHLNNQLLVNNLDECYGAINNFSRLSTGELVGIDPFTDEEPVIKKLFDEQSSSFLKWATDDERAFWGNEIAPDTFVEILAGEKGNKSSFLRHIAFQAVKEGRKVAFFECGDSTEPQVQRRILQMLAKRPRFTKLIKFPSALTVQNTDNSVADIQVEFGEEKERDGLNFENAMEAITEFRTELQSKYSSAGLFKLICSPAGTMSVGKIDSILEEWERHNWTPEIVVIDYADLLLSMSRSIEKRHQLDDDHKRLRGLSQKWRCCVLTATQATGSAGKVNFLTEEHVAEAKTKKAHVTAMVGLNCTEAEKEKQVRKMNYILRREEECSNYRAIYFAQCLDCWLPAVQAYFPHFHEHPSRYTIVNNTDTELDVAVPSVTYWTADGTGSETVPDYLTYRQDESKNDSDILYSNWTPDNFDKDDDSDEQYNDWRADDAPF